MKASRQDVEGVGPSLGEMNFIIARTLLTNAKFPPEDLSLALARPACQRVMRTEEVAFQSHFDLQGTRVRNNV
jgi:hypothetical protein